ncbi:hypothetical protein Q7P37_010863 [Cladosporium fusiforme]
MDHTPTISGLTATMSTMAIDTPHFQFRKLLRELRDAILDEVSNEADEKPEVLPLPYMPRPFSPRLTKKSFNSKEGILLVDRDTYHEYCDARLRTLLASKRVFVQAPGHNISGLVKLIEACSAVEGRTAAVAAKLELHINAMQHTFILPPGKAFQLKFVTNFLNYCVERDTAFPVKYYCLQIQGWYKCPKGVAQVLEGVSDDLQQSEQYKKLKDANFMFGLDHKPVFRNGQWWHYGLEWKQTEL